LYAQKIPVTVTLVFEKKDTIAEATIQLYRSADSALVAAQKFTSAGNIFFVPALTTYRIKVSSIGYHDEESLITVKDKALKMAFHLRKNETTLSGVVVTSKKQLLKQEDDKTIVDATALANSSTNAFEVLEKTPGTIIDQDGNVYLNSNAPATVYINGREMKLSSNDIASLLKSLPAGSVSKIELLRTPSAKYDAASSGGIVNIVLKKRCKTGQQWQCEYCLVPGGICYQNCGYQR
jgi:outer membrane receptor protein involved in Fe transport